MANFLVAKGWQRGRDWGFEVTIPEKISCAQEGPDLAQTALLLGCHGHCPRLRQAFPEGGTVGLDDDARSGRPPRPGIFGDANFYVLKEYNNSDLYAMFIGNLADRIAYGSGAFTASWGNVGHMLRSDVLTMQKSLAAKGYDIGKADGLAGFKTRRSLGDWQAKNGLAPTCFPDESLKARL